MIGAIIAIIILIWSAAVNALRLGDNYALARVLPFSNGEPVTVYDIAGCAVLFIFFLLLREIVTMPRERKDDRRSFRHSLWLVPLSLVLADYIRRNVEPSIHYRTVLDQSHIPNPERFSQFLVLIATCSAILAIAYVVKKR
jgi:hypothetical protein